MRPIIPSKKQNKSGQKTFFVFALLLIVFFSVNPGAFRAVSSWFNRAAAPLWGMKNSSASALPSSDIFLRSKTSLIKENEDLRQEIVALHRNLKGYDVVIQENLEFKKLFAGKKEAGVLAGVLIQSRHFPFDTILLDAGSGSGIENGELALVDENIVLGKIIETHPSSSKLKAFFSSGEVTDAFLGPENIPVQLKGAGGGAYTAELPRELDVREGDAAVLPGAEGFILAYVESKEENLTDSFQKLYFQVPVNVFQLKYVQVIHRAPGVE